VAGLPERLQFFKFKNFFATAIANRFEQLIAFGSGDVQRCNILKYF